MPACVFCCVASCGVVLALSGLTCVHHRVIATSGNYQADGYSRQQHFGRISLKISEGPKAEVRDMFVRHCRELQHVRFAPLWTDVPDCRVHFGVPADWETRRGKPSGHRTVV